MAQQPIVDFLRLILANDQVRIITLLIAANILAGVGASVYDRSFKLYALADFCRQRAVPYILGYVAVQMLAAAMPEFQPAVTVVWGLIITALAGHVIASLESFGINLPDALSKSGSVKLPQTAVDSIGNSLTDGIGQVTQALVKAVATAAVSANNNPASPPSTPAGPTSDGTPQAAPPLPPTPAPTT